MSDPLSDTLLAVILCCAPPLLLLVPRDPLMRRWLARRKLRRLERGTR